MHEPDTRTQHPIVSFLTITVFFQMMGGLMGWVTAQGVDGWYQSLSRSPLNPPDYLFGVVWTALYFLLAVAFWLLWKKPQSKERKRVLGLFAAHMILNWLWSPLFFLLHATGASLALLFCLIFTGAMLGWLAWPMDRRASLIFAPYLCWLIFAGHLTYYIWRMN